MCIFGTVVNVRMNMKNWILFILAENYVAVSCVQSSANNLCFQLFFYSLHLCWYALWPDIATFVRYEFIMVVNKGTSFVLLADELHCVGGNSTPVKEAERLSVALKLVYQATRCHIIRHRHFFFTFFTNCKLFKNITNLHCKTFKCIIFLF